MSAPNNISPYSRVPTGTIVPQRSWDNRLIETVPSSKPFIPPQPTIKPTGLSFTDNALPGNGTPAVAFATGKLVENVLKHIARDLGVTAPSDSLLASLHMIDSVLTKATHQELEPLICSFEKQHGMQLPKLGDFICERQNEEHYYLESIYKRREAFLDAIQKVSLHQPQHMPNIPTHSGNQSSPLNPANFDRLV